MIYNGEVYNVNELKNRLKRGNNIQDGICDTRLLLEHFDEFGISTDSINHIWNVRNMYLRQKNIRK